MQTDKEQRQADHVLTVVLHDAHQRPHISSLLVGVVKKGDQLPRHIPVPFDTEQVLLQSGQAAVGHVPPKPA